MKDNAGPDLLIKLKAFEVDVGRLKTVGRREVNMERLLRLRTW